VIIVQLDGLRLFRWVNPFGKLTEHDVNGFPATEPEETAMPRFERPFRSIEELHETQLDDFETMFRSGSAMAIPAAIHYCAAHGLVPPAWLTKATDDLLCSLLRGDTPKKRGRASSPVARCRQDMIDLDRWDEVCIARKQQENFRRNVTELRALPKTPRELPQKREILLEEHTKMHDWLEHTLDRAFECASMNLVGTEAAGRPDAVKQSYFRVEKNSRDPKQAMRYHVFETRFLRKLGLKTPLDVPQVKKVVPMYDLTIR
jgi:hypothetical protein